MSKAQTREDEIYNLHRALMTSLLVKKVPENFTSKQRKLKRLLKAHKKETANV